MPSTTDYPVSNFTLTNTYSIFILLILLLIFLWVCAPFVTIWYDNLFFRTLDFDITSTWDTFAVAVLVISIFLLFTYLLKYMGFLPSLEMRLLGVSNEEKFDSKRIKGGASEKVIDLSQNPELQGAIVPRNSILTQLRLQRS